MEKEILIEKKEHKKLFKFIKITITILLIITLFLMKIKSFIKKISYGNFLCAFILWHKNNMEKTPDP